VSWPRPPGSIPSTRVLDLGWGIVGPARYLAATFGCKVTGIDLNPAFLDAASGSRQHPSSTRTSSEPVVFHGCLPHPGVGASVTVAAEPEFSRRLAALA
jgi:SAM-dependent methyltransferase